MSNPFDTAYTAALAKEKRDREHTITIYVRGCDTTRECYCRNTNGYSHTEYESPWVVDMEGNFERGGKEVLLDPWFRPGEDLDEYRERMARAEAWVEGLNAGLNHDIRVENGYDPEPNPYL